MISNFLNRIDLVWTCVIVFLIGLVVLFFIVVLLEPITLEINNIGEDDVGKIVSVNGTVIEKTVNKGNFFLEIESDGHSIKAVMFENDIKSLNLTSISRGSFVNLIGKIEKYRGGLEIIIKDVKVIN